MLELYLVCSLNVGTVNRIQKQRLLSGGCIRDREVTVVETDFVFEFGLTSVMEPTCRMINIYILITLIKYMFNFLNNVPYSVF